MLACVGRTRTSHALSVDPMAVSAPSLVDSIVRSVRVAWESIVENMANPAPAPQADCSLTLMR